MKLLGKVIIDSELHIITGIRIGGAQVGLKIGGIDTPVIVDAGGRPYIPGSSLRVSRKNYAAPLRCAR